jgi:hypothetical protein
MIGRERVVTKIALERSKLEVNSVDVAIELPVTVEELATVRTHLAAT